MSLLRLRLSTAALTRSLWFRPALFAALSVVAVAIAPLADPFVPTFLSDRLTPDDLDRILGVLASGMLAVAIFSLGTMVQALQAAAGAATPRARPLLTSDETAQTAISTFIGAFVFSVIGLVGLSFDVYGPASRVAMMALSLALIVIVIVVLVAWIRRLSGMGGVMEAIDMVSEAAADAFDDLARTPFCGGAEAAAPPEGATPVRAEAFGWVRAIDAAALCRIAGKIDFDVHVAARPGAAVLPGKTLAWVAGSCDAATRAAIRGAFVVGRARSFDGDPRFGLVVLSEIASRALSPAVNDPGTAIDVIAAEARVLAGWAGAARAVEPREPLPRLFAPPLAAADAFEDAFRAIARDGAAMVEVTIKLQKALAALAGVDHARFGEAARALGDDAFARMAAVAHPADVELVAALRRDLGLAA